MHTNCFAPSETLPAMTRGGKRRTETVVEGKEKGKARVCVFVGVWVEQGWCCSGGARIGINY